MVAPVPVGIITDRDIVVAVMAPGLDPSVITVGDVMASELETVKEHQSILETIHKMRSAGIRLIPVVSGTRPTETVLMRVR